MTTHTNLINTQSILVAHGYDLVSQFLFKNDMQSTYELLSVTTQDFTSISFKESMTCLCTYFDNLLTLEN